MVTPTCGALLSPGWTCSSQAGQPVRPGQRPCSWTPSSAGALGRGGGQASGPGMLSPQQPWWGMAGLVWRGRECGPQGRWGYVPGHLLVSATLLGAEEVVLLPGLHRPWACRAPGGWQA